MSCLEGRAAARPHVEAIGDIVEDAHMPEQGIGLKNETDAAILHAQSRRVFAAEQNKAGVRSLETGDDAQQRRLAGTGRPEQRHQFARRDRQVDIPEDGLAAEILGDPHEVDLLPRRRTRHARGLAAQAAIPTVRASTV